MKGAMGPRSWERLDWGNCGGASNVRAQPLPKLAQRFYTPSHLLASEIKPKHQHHLDLAFRDSFEHDAKYMPFALEAFIGPDAPPGVARQRHVNASLRGQDALTVEPISVPEPSPTSKTAHHTGVTD